MAAAMMSRACVRLGRVSESAFVYNRVSYRNAVLLQSEPQISLERAQWSRSYRTRGLRRTPVKIILPDGVAVDHRGKELKQRNKVRHDHEQIKEKTLDDRENPVDDSQVPHYIKLGENTKLFTSVIQLTRNRKSREKQGKILLEGHRLIQDAIDAGVEINSIFFSLEKTLMKLRLPSSTTNLKLYKVMYKDMCTWSSLVTCPGLMGICHTPNYDTMNVARKSSAPITLLCDNIRDPTNLGSIIRCAAAAGCDKVILTRGCVDAWDPKVLRSASGAHFHIRLEPNVEWAFVGNYLPNEFSVYLAAPDASYHAEGEELSSNFEDASIEGLVEDSIGSKASKWYEVADDGRVRDPTFEGEEKLSRYRRLPLKRLSYMDGNYGSQKHSLLVIGGETEGLGDEAYKLAYDHDGASVSIPLGNGVDSLNAAVAAGIMLFEMQRQMNIRKSRSMANANM